MRTVLLTIALLGSIATASAQKQAEPLGIALEGYSYPYEVRYLPLSVGTHPVRMAFMDVAPSGASNGRTVLLMHGRNFPASYRESTIEALSTVGFGS
jgi:hypothetical protein